MRDYLVVDNTIRQKCYDLINRIDLRDFNKFFEYYTIWGLLVHFLLPDYGFLLLLKFQMALQIAVGGFYITYVHPRYIFVPFWKIILCQFPLYFADFISHYIPLIYYLTCYQLKYTSFSDFLVGIPPFLCYICLNNFFDKYHIGVNDFFMICFFYIFISTFIGYFFFFSTE